MHRSFSAFVALILLASLLFCTIDNVHSHESEHEEYPVSYHSVVTSTGLISNPVNHHDKDVCCDELLSDIPRYLTFIHYEHSALHPVQSPNTFATLNYTQNIGDEQVSLWWYHTKVPDRIHRRFSSEYAITNPPTGPPV